MHATCYARTPLIFAVHQQSKVGNVNLTEISAIYAGKMHNWPDGSAIRPILRLQSDSDTKLLLRVFPQLAAPISMAYKQRGVHVALTDQDNAERIASIPGGFGTSSLAQILSEKLPLKALSLNEVSPTLKSTGHVQYPLYKELYYVHKSNSGPAVSAFITFLHSATAQKILRATGHDVIKTNGEKCSNAK